MHRKHYMEMGHAVWQNRRRKRIKRWCLAIVGAIVLLLIVLGSYAYNNYRSAANNSYYPTQRQYQRNPQKQIHAKHALSILFLGTDTDHLGMSHQGTTDTMIIMTINPQTHRSTMTYLPENMKSSYDGHTLPLNQLYDRGGVPAVTKSVQQTMRIPVDYYILSDTKGLAKTAGQVGGVNVTPSQTFRSNGISFRSGKSQVMDQRQVLAYLKSHGTGTQADQQRQMRNKQVLTALFGKVSHHPLDSSAASSLSSDIHTDLSFSDLERLAIHYRGAAQNKQHVSLNQDVMSKVKSDPRFAQLSPQQKQKAIAVIRQNLGI